MKSRFNREQQIFTLYVQLHWQSIVSLVIDLISECKPFTRAHSYCHTQEHAQKASLRVEKGMDLALGELEMPVSLTEESSDEVLSEAYG